MAENRKFEPPKEIKDNAWIKNFSDYKKMWDESINDPETFWSKIANDFVWFKKWDKVRSYDFKNNIDIKFFEGAKTNISVNCLDRWVKDGKGDRVAIIWEGNDPSEVRNITYKELLDQTCKFANVLKAKGVKKGDRVSIYMPMVPELPVVMLACTRIGAVHSVVFGGFSAESLRDRILDSKCKVLITADGSFRAQKSIPLKKAADDAMKMCDEARGPVDTCIVLKR